jgi:two-component system sensor histidine kinase KdpD
MKNKIVNNIIFSVIALALSTLFAFAFEGFGFRAENIMLVYVGTIMLIMMQTKKNVYGITSTFLLVFIFNFFFTEPKLTFKIDDPNYIVTLIIFTLVSITMGTLTNQLQREIFMSKENEKRLQLLYQNIQLLLQAKNKTEILAVAKENLKKLIPYEVFFVFLNNYLSYENEENIFFEEYGKNIEFSIEQNMIVGKGEKKYNDIPIIIFPICGTKNINGALIIDCQKNIITKQEKDYVQTAILNLVTALDRNQIALEEENIRIEMEKERIKSALLRSISHDLRTPLTTLKTGTSFLYESYSKIDEETKKSMLLDINNETSRLNDFVENLLNMTRLTANKFNIKRDYEFVDEILMDVYRRVKNRLIDHQLEIIRNENTTKVYVDAQLLTQVFINLIDNAIRHTEKGTKIKISYQIENKQIIFKVEDNGSGIKKKNLEKIFENFTSIETKKEDNFRGMGLGLSICHAIISAHNGGIKAYNNDLGGATFEFNIPLEKE